MQNSMPASERVRPILQAMERSISEARQRRLQGSPCEEEPVIPTPAPIENDDQKTGQPPRLKARPKRATPFPSSVDGGAYRSQAG